MKNHAKKQYRDSVLLAVYTATEEHAEIISTAVMGVLFLFAPALNGRTEIIWIQKKAGLNL